MRMRSKKNLASRLERCAAYFVDGPAAYRGEWREFFGRERLCVEIGCGKGKFLNETALQFPDTGFIGIERIADVIVMGGEKCAAAQNDNLRFITADASCLCDVFAPGEIDLIYLNFCDPWPPKKQAKRRLTHSLFLTRYRDILAPGGEIHFKTDNQKLFEFSLNEMSGFGMTLKNITFDLHSTDTPNITTEYEDRFSAMNMPIYRLEAVFHD